MLYAVKLRVLGLMAYWYTGSAFHQIPQSYLSSTVYRDHESQGILGHHTITPKPA